MGQDIGINREFFSSKEVCSSSCQKHPPGVKIMLRTSCVVHIHSVLAFCGGRSWSSRCQQKVSLLPRAHHSLEGRNGPDALPFQVLPAEFTVLQRHLGNPSFFVVPAAMLHGGKQRAVCVPVWLCKCPLVPCTWLELAASRPLTSLCFMHMDGPSQMCSKGFRTCCQPSPLESALLANAAML